MRGQNARDGDAAARRLTLTFVTLAAAMNQRENVLLFQCVSVAGCWRGLPQELFHYSPLMEELWGLAAL